MGRLARVWATVVFSARGRCRVLLEVTEYAALRQAEHTRRGRPGCTADPQRQGRGYDWGRASEPGKASRVTPERLRRGPDTIRVRC